VKQDSFFSLRVFPVLFMAAITLVCITVVTGIHLATEERVRLNELVFQRMAVLDAAGIDYPEDDAEGVQDVYEQRVSSENGWYTVELEDGETGYVISVSGAGLWGEIELRLGFRENLEEMTGIAVVSHNETPGLGARIEEQWFTEQFRGKRGPFEAVPEGTAEQEDEIDGITGATSTTEAVKDIINRGIREAPSIVGED